MTDEELDKNKEKKKSLSRIKPIGHWMLKGISRITKKVLLWILSELCKGLKLLAGNFRVLFWKIASWVILIAIIIAIIDYLISTFFSGLFSFLNWFDFDLGRFNPFSKTEDEERGMLDKLNRFNPFGELGEEPVEAQEPAEEKPKPWEDLGRFNPFSEVEEPVEAEGIADAEKSIEVEESEEVEGAADEEPGMLDKLNRFNPFGEPGEEPVEAQEPAEEKPRLWEDLGRFNPFKS